MSEGRPRTSSYIIHVFAHEAEQEEKPEEQEIKRNERAEAGEGTPNTIARVV
jgi:riboflavin synthase